MSNSFGQSRMCAFGSLRYSRKLCGVYNGSCVNVLIPRFTNIFCSFPGVSYSGGRLPIREMKTEKKRSGFPASDTFGAFTIVSMVFASFFFFLTRTT